MELFRLAEEAAVDAAVDEMAIERVVDGRL